MSRKPPRDNKELLRRICPGLDGPGRVESEAVPSLRQIVLVDNSAGRVDAKAMRGAVPFEELLHGSKQALPDQGLHKDDVVNLQFTSGTTSMPKAACLSHRSILIMDIRLEIVCC